jgi:serine O-acetyltransferase
MLFEEIRKAYEVHQRRWRNRAIWSLAVYWFGRWSLGLSNRPLRWVTSKIYGVLNIVSQIVTGVHMVRDVRIGDGFHIIHAATIFIHSEVVIGDRVGVMHNVTIGTNMSSEVPVIGNDVFIGAGASVLGKVRVGDGARIAANSLVIMDVPEGAFAVGVPAKVFKRPGVGMSKREDPTAPPRGAP